MSMGFDLDSETRRRLGHKLVAQIDAWFSTLPDRAVQLPADQRTFGDLANPLPEIGEDAEKLLDDICRDMIDKGFHVPSANYFGLMNPTPTYIGVLAEFLVAALNPQLATMARSQLASKIERETVRWIGERIFCPGGRSNLTFDGTFTSGGNEANFSALALALAAHFPAAVEDGIASIGARPLVYASAESHHSIDKSAGLLGIGRRSVRRIAADSRLHMRLDALETAVQQDRSAGHKPFCVVATAGTTNSGAVDEVTPLADFCGRHRLWLHVDGAYGAAAAFSDKHRDLVRGLERADSVTIDPHKWLAMPFAAGVVVTRHPETLQQAFAVAAPYMPRAQGARLADNCKISTQWSRRMNSLKLWLTLRVHGRQAYEEHFERTLQLARSFADWIRRSEHYELALEPELAIVNFRVKGAANDKETAAANDAVEDAVTRDGRRWISVTQAGGRSVLRMMVISYLTGERNLHELQEALTAAARQLHISARQG